MATPQTGHFSSTPILWSDGSQFNGFALIGLVPPTDGIARWTSVTLGDQFPGYQLPAFSVIPIVNGVLHQSLGLFYNSDIDPPSTQYTWWAYDSTKRMIAGPSAMFTVTGSSISLPALTLTVPTVSTAPPTPDA